MKSLFICIVFVGLAACLQFPLTLSFDYAPNQKGILQRGLANVLWNNVIVLSIVPTNYHVVSVSVTVTANVGTNTLQFEDGGLPDSNGYNIYGLGVTNVALIRVGDTTKTNLLINGDFSQPIVDPSYALLDSIPGWTGPDIYIGARFLSSSSWPLPIRHKQLIQLQGLDQPFGFPQSITVTQTITFNNLFQVISNPVVPNCTVSKVFRYHFLRQLSVYYTLTNVGTTNTQTSQGNALWNNVIVGHLYDTKFTNKTLQISFPVNISTCGQNYIQLDGTSTADGFGIAIKNVTVSLIYPPYTIVPLTNIWTANKPKFAKCSTFNNLLDATEGASTCSGTNQRYTQYVPIPYIPSKVFDTQDAIPVAGFQCLAAQGYTDVILRADSDTLGVLSSTVVQTINNAVAAHVKPQVYVTLCPGLDPVSQVNTILNKLSFTPSIWFKVAISSVPLCKWSTNQTKNCNFLAAALKAVYPYKLISTTSTLWNSYFGTACSFANDGVLLWYTKYKPDNSIDSTPSFADYAASGGFGGWAQPDIKQTATNVKVSCTTFLITINTDWHT